MGGKLGEGCVSSTADLEELDRWRPARGQGPPRVADSGEHSASVSRVAETARAAP